MRFDILTLFPDLCRTIADCSILKRAQEKGAISVFVHDPRHQALDAHKTVDDTPYGGGVGMVLKVDVMDAALHAVTREVDTIERRRTIMLTPQGRRFTQEIAEEYGQNYDQITLVCGHYEGFDERIRSLVDEELSVGDFVLTGGELPAMIVVDAVSRLKEGVISDGGPEEESFSLTDENGQRLLEYPQYTRPLEYKGMKVPDVLTSGHHAEIAKWRLEQAKLRTAQRRS
jgi:tRNA (guanine37-N1)-methyltransferase